MKLTTSLCRGNTENKAAVAIADQVSLSDDAAHLGLRLPDVVRFGARWAFLSGDHQVADIELDVVFETWSQMEAFEGVTD